MFRIPTLAAVVVSTLNVTGLADAQTIGTFRWRMLPYCNTFTLT
jgi:hypothetical protein